MYLHTSSSMLQDPVHLLAALCKAKLTRTSCCKKQSCCGVYACSSACSSLCLAYAARAMLTAKTLCFPSGTAIETNINGRFRLTLHKAATLEPKLQNLEFGLLENANEYVVHGLTVKVKTNCTTSAGLIK